MARSRLFEIGALSVLVGCAAAEPASQRSPLPAAGIEVRLENHVAWPFDLRHVTVSVDDRVVYEARSLERGAVLKAELPPSAGEHVLEVVARSRYESGSFDATCEVELRAVRTFRTSVAPAAIALDLHQRGATQPFDERLDLAVRVRGATLGPFDRSPVARNDAHCDDLIEVEAALCRAEARVELARREGDSDAVECASSHIDEMKKLAGTIQRVGLERLADPNAHADATGTLAIRVSESRILDLSDAVAACPIAMARAADRTEIVVNDRSCAGDFPIDPSDPLLEQAGYSVR